MIVRPAEGAEARPYDDGSVVCREPPPHRVVVCGAGLIGTSVALALTRCGTVIELTDRDPDAVRVATGRKAGVRLAQRSSGEPADVAVLAVPPDAVAEALHTAQRRDLAAVYTDVASVKSRPVADAAALGCDMSMFVPGHPLAGSEKAGPMAARADLFDGRRWVLCAGPDTDPTAVRQVRALVRACGAVPREMSPGRHDRAVAMISHAPHVVSSAMAARLLDGGPDELDLVGQGFRDVTRIAGGSPALWLQILTANAGPVADVLEAIADELGDVAQALRAAERATGEPVAQVAALLERGTAGRDRASISGV